MSEFSDKVLVVIPTLLLDASFSAPLAWMFSHHVDRVEGIFGFELTAEKVRQHHRFIVELNWFVELYEFGLLVKFIRRHNKGAEILFGGMYASINPEEIFRRYPVDLTIQGDNEVPMQLYLDGVSPREVPNFMGADFKNPIGYVFKEADYLGLDFNLEWFPSHFRYRDAKNSFFAPHIVTAKGGCDAAHVGCEHCMGAQYDRLRVIYGRPPIHMSERSLFHLLRNVEKRYREASLYITRADKYEFAGERFDLDVTVEIDSPVSVRQVANLVRAFRRMHLLLPIYQEGIRGGVIDGSRYAELIQLEDPDHQIRFYVLHQDAEVVNIPRDHIMFSEVAYPESSSFAHYAQIDKATEVSRRFYETCDRKFTDGVPRLDAKNAHFYLQMLRFTQDFL